MYSKEQLLQLISYIDLTSLESVDNNTSINELVNKANKGYHKTYVAAVCAFPTFADTIQKIVKPEIRLAVVGGCFPSGQTFLSTKIDELNNINKSAANEVDIVINRGAFLAGEIDIVVNELKQMRAAVKDKLLKVILETGELKIIENIALASKIAIEAGADFIKTSTGKSLVGATLPAVEIMCAEIHNYYLKTEKKIGIKPSGGIKTIADAMQYIELIKKQLGDEWLNNSYFRIGASSLYDSILAELAKYE